MRKIKCLLIRHGSTAGNEKRLYVGAGMDEPLSETGRKEVEEAAGTLRETTDALWENIDEAPETVDVQPEAVAASKEAVNTQREKSTSTRIIYAGKMLRCRETAQLLFPEDGIREADFTEMNFGIFEGKNYGQLSEEPTYQAWIDSNGLMKIPGGESRDEFVKRSLESFHQLLKETPDQFVLVCHGGTIMAVLSELTGKSYYDFQVPNLSGYAVEFSYEDGKVTDVRYGRLQRRPCVGFDCW